MKQFNLEEFKKNPFQKVITRDGRNVRIICIDFKNEQPILALITEGNREDIHFYYQNGAWCNEFPENKLDLFFAPTKREGWINVFDNFPKENHDYYCNKIYKTKEDAEKDAKKYNIDNYVTTTKIEWEEE